MQIRWGKPPRVRQLAELGWELSREAVRRLEWMNHYLHHGRNAAFTCHHFGISRQCFYRWWRRYDPHNLNRLEARSHRPHQLRRPSWSVEQADRVLILRRQYPRWGKDKLRHVLLKQGLLLSVSTVGRILTDLKRRGVLVEAPPTTVLLRQHRKLRHRPWATRKPRFWRVREPGDLVALDSKQVRPARGVMLQHFSARDLVSRWDVGASPLPCTATAVPDRPARIRPRIRCRRRLARRGSGRACGATGFPGRRARCGHEWSRRARPPHA